MGAITFSADPRLVEFFVEQLKLDVFVETGTFEGATVAQVADMFSDVYSVELSDQYYQEAAEKFRSNEKIKIIHGHSPEALKNLKNILQGRPTFYWLDAHWCVAINTAGESSQCPLLDELAAIKELDKGSVIVIDDARLFLAAPPAPHEVTHWPTFDEIIKNLYRLSAEHHIGVLNDCIVFYPKVVEEAFQAFSHKHSVDWLHLANQSRSYEAIEGKPIVKKSIWGRILERQ